MPTLVLNGRYDFESHTKRRNFHCSPCWDLPPEHKRHVVLETGHALPIGDLAREILPWLDRYLGPVVPRGSPKESGP